MNARQDGAKVSVDDHFEKLAARSLATFRKHPCPHDRRHLCIDG